MHEQTFVNPHAGKTGRDGGPYLDQENREFAEKNRARVEGREPDYPNATFDVGTPATRADVMATRPDVVSHPSMLAEANAGSVNNGAEVLPVDDTVGDYFDEPVKPEDTESGEGHPVKEYAALGEVTDAEGATVNSPLLVGVDFNKGKAKDHDNEGESVTDPNLLGGDSDDVTDLTGDDDDENA